MPRSLDDILSRSDELADRFEAYEPAPGDEDSVSPLTTLWLAATRRTAAERDLADAVVAARAAGIAWREIGTALGTSGEAARQRYGRHAAG